MLPLHFAASGHCSCDRMHAGHSNSMLSAHFAPLLHAGRPFRVQRSKSAPTPCCPSSVTGLFYSMLPPAACPRFGPAQRYSPLGWGGVHCCSPSATQRSGRVSRPPTGPHAWLSGYYALWYLQYQGRDQSLPVPAKDASKHGRHLPQHASVAAGKLASAQSLLSTGPQPGRTPPRRCSSMAVATAELPLRQASLPRLPLPLPPLR
jgi:hypothetical protein